MVKKLKPSQDWSEEATDLVLVATPRSVPAYRLLSLRAYGAISVEEITGVTRDAIRARMRDDLSLDEMAEIRRILVSRERHLNKKGRK